jgi:predicted dehydrogenase
MTKVKVIGAGSIGNHLSNAARKLGWQVTIVDVDPVALSRTKEKLYPDRYGAWDDDIDLCLAHEAPKGVFDYIFVGTPPDSHMAVALAALDEKPRAILVEKPVCPPDLADAQTLWERSQSENIPVFVGYDHVVGMASRGVEEIIASGSLGPIDTLDVDFREHWGGIFAAHFWLDGPGDSYLGYWRRGGGASGEHSHAANLWQHFALLAGAGRVVEVSATMSYMRDDVLDYDKVCLLTLTTENGLVGRVAQDVVTSPPRKSGRIQGRDGFVEWHCGYQPGYDAVITGEPESEPNLRRYETSRPDDFVQELRHMETALASKADESPITLQRGLDTMLVVAAAHRSAREKRAVRIDYAKGYTDAALDTA